MYCMIKKEMAIIKRRWYTQKQTIFITECMVGNEVQIRWRVWKLPLHKRVVTYRKKKHTMCANTIWGRRRTRMQMHAVVNKSRRRESY